MSEKEEVYRQFIDWLKRTWWDLPEREELMPMISAHYSPEEAQILNGMPFSNKSLEELAEMKQIEPAKLKEFLDALAKKGAVFRTVTSDSTRYRLNDSFFVFLRAAFWPENLDTATRAMAPFVNKYFLNGWFDQFNLTHLRGLRTLPILETIEDKREILPYEEVVKVLDAREYFSVSMCPCRQRHNLDPTFPKCPHPTEVCLHFDRLGRYIVENGMGREITRNETEDILRHCAEVGLVHGLTNVQEGPDTICNCCRCCCMWFESFHKLKHSKSMDSSNYIVHTNEDTCIGCGLCVKRCPMNARKLVDAPEAKNRTTIVVTEKGEVELKNKTGKISVLQPELCIGCGVCAYKCPSKSLVLERRTVIYHPPLNQREEGQIIAADLAAGRDRAKEGKG